MRKLTTQQFVDKARIVHGDKYNYSEVAYTTSHIPVTIYCSLHGMFEQSPNTHLNGTGCPKCCKPNRQLSNQYFDEKLEAAGRGIWRIGEYEKAHEALLVMCRSCGHTWQAMPTKLTGKTATGCPSCRTGKFGRFTEVDGIRFRSILEGECYRVVTIFCNTYKLDFECQKKYQQSTTNHSCDFYIPNLKLWIEVSGIKTEEYHNRLQKKMEWVQQMNETFMFATSTEHLKELLYGQI